MKGQILQLCLNCTEKFRKNPLCEEFRNPVNVPNYRNIIKNPMDLNFIYEHLNEREYYKDSEEWARDFRLIFDNAMVFNGPDDAIHALAKYLKGKFEKCYARIQLSTPTQYVKKTTELYSNYLEILTHPPSSSNLTIDLPRIEKLGKGFEEASLDALTAKLNKISNPQRYDELQKIIQGNSTGNQDIEVDIGMLPPETIKELWKFVRKIESQESQSSS